MNEYLISVEGMKVINEQIVSAIIARWNEVIDAIRSDDSFYSEQLKERYVDKLVDDMKEWMMYGYIRVVAKDEELTFIPVIVNEITEVAATRNGPIHDTKRRRKQRYIRRNRIHSRLFERE